MEKSRLNSVVFQGYTIAELSRITRIPYPTLLYRYHKGKDMFSPQISHTTLHELNGVKMTAPNWARKLGVERCTIHNRLYRGQNVDGSPIK